MGYKVSEDKKSMWLGIGDNMNLLKKELEDKDFATAKRRVEYTLKYDYDLLPPAFESNLKTIKTKIDDGESNGKLISIVDEILRRWF